MKLWGVPIFLYSFFNSNQEINYINDDFNW
jgi:hypothetical protein